jgi:hypothetical protein
MFAQDVFFPACRSTWTGFVFDDLQPGMTVRFDLTFDERTDRKRGTFA